MSNFQDSFLSGSNIDFIEALYARFLEDPRSVDASWRELFERQRGQGRPIYVNGRGGNGAQAAAAPSERPPGVMPPVAPAALRGAAIGVAQAAAVAAAPSPSAVLQAKVAQAVY